MAAWFLVCRPEWLLTLKLTVSLALDDILWYWDSNPRALTVLGQCSATALHRAPALTLAVAALCMWL